MIVNASVSNQNEQLTSSKMRKNTHQETSSKNTRRSKQGKRQEHWREAVFSADLARRFAYLRLEKEREREREVAGVLSAFTAQLSALRRVSLLVALIFFGCMAGFSVWENCSKSSLPKIVLC